MSEVSVVLLTYNHEKTIARAIESVLSQNTSFNYKIHILDDCSSDRTVDICKELHERNKDKLIIHSNKVNIGVFRNLKNGLSVITSKYYALLEGDDHWCDENKLQLQYEALENNPQCTMCGHNVLYNNMQTGTQSLFVAKEDCVSTGIYDIESDVRIHTSSRFIRNCRDLSLYPDYMMLDACLYIMYLDAGQLYYIDRVMSVYNRTGEGYWSGRDRKKRLLMMLEYRFRANKLFEFKYDKFFYKNSLLLRVLKQVFGKRLSWHFFYGLERLRIHLKYF